MMALAQGSYSAGPAVLGRGNGAIFLAAFCFAVVAGFVIQLVVLPYILPSIHAGHGLLAGGDGVGFHVDAARLADRIAQEGWGSYQLRPRGQAPIGIAVMLYWAVGIHEPWVLLPMHAALFALVVTGFYNIFSRVAERRIAAAAALLLVCLPSSVMLYAQIHKDVWAIAGTVWIFAVMIAYAMINDISLRQQLALISLTVAGAAIVWLVRAYLLQLLLIGLLTAVAMLAILTLLSFRKRSLASELSRFAGMLVCIFVVMAFSFDMPTRVAAIVNPNFATLMAPPSVVDFERPVIHVPMIPVDFDKILDDQQRKWLQIRDLDPLLSSLDPKQRKVWDDWQRQVDKVVIALTPKTKDFDYLPSFIARRIELIIDLRRGAVQSGMAAGSAIDNDAKLRDVGEIVRYIPRATQIALLAPFPNMWFTSGLSPGSRLMRSVSGIEMMLAYALYLGFIPLFLLSSSDVRRGVMVAMSLVVPILILLAVTIPNIGTLYRMRYGYFFLLLGLGVIGWGYAIEHWRRRRAAAAGHTRRPDAAPTS